MGEDTDSKPIYLPDGDKSFWDIYEVLSCLGDALLMQHSSPKLTFSGWDAAQKGETIGRGHFAKVKLVRHRQTGEFYAAKILDKTLEEHQEDYDSMMREFIVLKALRHPNIVHLHDAYETRNSLFLVCQLGQPRRPGLAQQHGFASGELTACCVGTATGGELMHRIAEENAVYTEAEV